MTLIELKKSIHQKIDESNDRELLEIIDTLLTNRNKVFQIPEEHLAGIRQGEEDIKNGHFFTIEDFEKKYEKYLK